jgi:Ulp1 family protease
LLIYEAGSKKFYHYDTLPGANYALVKPAVEELLKQLLQTNEPDLNACLVKKHNIKQRNGHDCGVAAIEIAKRIMEKYTGDLSSLDLGKLDFPRARKE